MASPERELAIEHLSLLHVAPPDLAHVAADSGFQAIGVRVFHPEPRMSPWPMLAGSAMLSETGRRCAELGLRVLTVESLSLTPQLRRADYEAVLEAGAHLRAEYVNVISDDPDQARARDTFAALAEAAAEYGLRPALEPIYHRAASSVEQAVNIAVGSGGAVQIDVLHLYRSGGTADTVRAIDPRLLSYLQVDDGPAAAPDSVEGRRQESRAGRLLPGEGELPIRSVVDAMPARAVLALEVTPPDPAEDPLAFARRARRALLDAVAD
jgi:sugar phosphate isomerase/epimerase